MSQASIVPERNPLRILVVGGGPVGLSFAACLKALKRSEVEIVVREARWVENDFGSVRWKNPEEGVFRRQQVVTIQSAVIDSLPDELTTVLFPAMSYSCVWPLGSESPSALGAPRNTRLMDIEDRLLGLCQRIGVQLEAGRVLPAEIDLSNWHLVVAADGPNSDVRQHFQHLFGKDDPVPFSIGGEQVKDTVLALKVSSKMSDPNTVVLTIAQNRFLFNGHNGDGYLYMRLTRTEEDEVRGRTPEGEDIIACIQSRPCMMTVSDGDGTPCCTTHGTQFGPALNPHSFLWARVQEGLRLFDCELSAVTVFRLAMFQRPKFVTELTQTGTMSPVFGALIGDAGNSIHFWPGRGLNSGFYSAVSLARSLHVAWRGQNLRSADFTAFEGVMSSLQHRHKDRAWRAMVQTRNGRVQAVKDILSEGLEGDCAMTRDDLMNTMLQRVQTLSNGLNDRLPMKPSYQDIKLCLEQCEDKTLNAFVLGGPWERGLSGGSEVKLDRMIPNPRSRGRSANRNGQSSDSPITDMPDGDSISVMSFFSESSLEQRILSEESARASFAQAVKFVGRDTLPWSQAVHELRALLIRANVGHHLSSDDIRDEVEKADRDKSMRIDVEEFVNAVAGLIHCSGSNVDQLGNMWREKFLKAADSNEQVDARIAAILVVSIAGELTPQMSELVDRTKLERMFIDKCGNQSNLVSLELYMEISAMIMFGN